MGFAFLIMGTLAMAAAVGAETAPVAPAAANPFKVGEEVVLLADGPGKGLQDTPAVAFGKSQYLVVWREGSMVKGGRARILASRVSTDGKVLDPKSIEVAPNKNADGPQAYPRVAFCPSTGSGPAGGVFLVVWQDFRNGKDYDILGARISPEGKVLDAEPIKVAAGGGTQAMPDVATDGNGFMVVFQAHPDSPQQLGYKTLAVPVSLDGRAGPPAELMDQPHPVIAWDGANYLVAAAVGGHFYGRLLGPDGKPNKANPFDINKGDGGNPGGPAVLSISAQPGKGWFLATHRVRPDHWGWGGKAAMKCFFVSSDGKPSADIPGFNYKYNKKDCPNWIDIQDDKTAPYGPNASAWDGRHFVVVWQRFHMAHQGFGVNLDNSDLLAARVDGWKPVDADGLPVAASPAEEKWPALACEGPGKLLLVYTKGTPDGKVLVCARTMQTQQ